MTFDAEGPSDRTDRLARRERRNLYLGGVRALVALGAFAGAIAFGIASDGPFLQPHIMRGVIALAAAAAPFWLLALWASRWREPKVTVYALVFRDGENERTVVRDYLDDYSAAHFASKQLRAPWTSVRVGRGAPDPLFIGEGSIVDGVPMWRFLVPEWSLYRSPVRKKPRAARA